VEDRVVHQVLWTLAMECSIWYVLAEHERNKASATVAGRSRDHQLEIDSRHSDLKIPTGDTVRFSKAQENLGPVAHSGYEASRLDEAVTRVDSRILSNHVKLRHRRTEWPLYRLSEMNWNLQIQ